MCKRLVVVGTIISFTAACTSDTPTSTRRAGARSNDITSSSNAACVPNPPSRPAGLVDTVTAPTPWGVAVRDDGLAYFTELLNNGVGITSTQTRTVEGFISTGPIPGGIAFSPDDATAYVANEARPGTSGRSRI